MGCLVRILIACSLPLLGTGVTSSATNRLPLYEFNRSEATWVDLPGRACTGSDDLKPPWAWPISRLRLRIVPDSSGVPDTSSASAPTLWEKSVPGGICHWLAATPPADELCGESHACIRASRAGRYMFESLCEDCSSELCSRQAKPLDANGAFFVELPPRGGCVHIEQLPKIAGGLGKIRLAWDNDWDPTVAVHVIAGIFFMTGSKALSESSLVHAAIGGVGSVATMSLVAIWLVVRELKALNLTQSAMSVAVLTTMFGAGFHTMSDWSIADFTAWIAVRDPYYDLPVGACLAFVIVALVACAILQGASLGQRYFASPEEPTGEVEFVIGSDGRRIDILPAVPLQQRCLGWTLWAMGATQLLRGTHVGAVSGIIFAAVLHRRFMSGFVSWLLEDSAFSPEYFRPLISSAAFHEQSERCTAEEIERLQSFICENPEEIGAVENETIRSHLRRFSAGKAPHFMRSKVMEDEDELRRFQCALL